jgi:hypothetical protein
MKLFEEILRIVVENTNLSIRDRFEFSEQLEALFKSEINRVIGEDELVPAMDRSVAYQWERIEAEDRNQLRAEQRDKANDIDNARNQLKAIKEES